MFSGPVNKGGILYYYYLYLFSFPGNHLGLFFTVFKVLIWINLGFTVLVVANFFEFLVFIGYVNLYLKL